MVLVSLFIGLRCESVILLASRIIPSVLHSIPIHMRCTLSQVKVIPGGVQISLCCIECNFSDSYLVVVFQWFHVVRAFYSMGDHFLIYSDFDGINKFIPLTSLVLWSPSKRLRIFVEIYWTNDEPSIWQKQMREHLGLDSKTGRVKN